MALKRVCDITGTDQDVEICDVTIAGQSIKLDLSPAGADKLVDFFGSVVTVRHPHGDSSSNEVAPAPASAAEASGADESAVAEEIEVDAADDDDLAAAAVAEPVGRESAASERVARRGRRPASVKNVRKKAAARRPAKPVAQALATAEIREWARANGFEVGERGAIPGRIRSAYTLAHE